MAKNNAVCSRVFFILAIHFLRESGLNNGVVDAALEDHHHVIQMKSLVPASTCSDFGEGAVKSGKMKLSHRYGPCSPLHTENLARPSSEEILQQDELRINHMNKRSRFRRLGGLSGGTVKGSRLPIYGGLIGAGNYVVRVGLGTPRQEFTMIFDTGSNLTWTQCAPCSNTSCYTQEDPLYDPSASSTFSNACDPPSSCNYSYEYGDGSSSTGHLVRDTLALTDTDTYSNFIFGCGETNKGNFGTAAGLLGFGSHTDRYSFLSQTAPTSGLIFCYCIPASDSSSGHLSFGSAALSACSSDTYTSIIQHRSSPSFYYINLEGITLGGKPLPISPFQTILDTGTVISRLPPSAYDALQSAFTQSMSQFPSAPPLSKLMDTWYNLSAYSNFTAPEMILQFEESRQIRLHPSAIIWRESDSQVCLAFARNSMDTDKAIIGNYQQKALNILYDIRALEIQFGSQGC